MKDINKQIRDAAETVTLEQLPEIATETWDIKEKFKTREINRIAFPEISNE